MPGKTLAMVTGAQIFDFRNGSEWATIVLREWGNSKTNFGGQLIVHSDFGNYGHIWTNLGATPLKQFLIDSALRGERSYIMEKIAAGAHKEFDPDATVKCALDLIKEWRRDGSIGKEAARDAWDAIQYIDHPSSADLVAQALSEIDIFSDCYSEMARQRMRSDCAGFWSQIFVPFCELLGATYPELQKSPVATAA